jgi:hypothetical protein
MGSTAVVLYGLGGHLGNFDLFARTLVGTLIAKYGRHAVFKEQITRRDDFFDYLESAPLAPAHKIAELHIFCHSVGAGIFLAYGDPAVQELRNQALRVAAPGKVNFLQALAAEDGAILSDDFTRSPYIGQQAAIQANMAPDGFLKLWGCNSGVPGWIYSDNNVVDPADTSESYYWRALNERNVPKPAVAQAFADYFQRPCYGATSGAHIEVYNHGHWESSGRYKREVGRWPSGALRHRLTPDRGAYRRFVP